MDDLLVQTATKITTGRNDFGDVSYGSRKSVPCLYRDISDISNSTSNRYEVNETGILWFNASETVKLGDIYLLDTGEYMQITRIIVARTRVTDNVTEFIKCGVSRQRQVS